MESGDNEDRISQLPDPILHHILSKVSDLRHKNTTHLVRTCILLSKRWSNLWASFPYLWFDEWGCSNASDQFVHLVNAVLMLRDTSDVQSLYLRWFDDAYEHEPHHLVTWMQYAIDHNVKDLTVDAVLTEIYFKSPSGIFTCWSLEKLDLEITGYGYTGDGCVEIPEFVQLRRLRKLRLERFSSTHISLKALMSGCPVLEDMELSYCMLQDPDICSNSLKKLDLVFCEIKGARIRISVPNLQHLGLVHNDIDRSEVLLENLPSLVKASLQTDDYTGYNFGGKVSKILNYVSPNNEFMSGNKLSELLSFHNLKELRLDGSIMIDNLPIVAHFLHRSPNLELVTLKEQTVISLDPVIKQWRLKMDFDCPHLKDILATYDVRGGEVAKMLDDFCDDKCSCFEDS